MINSSDLKYFIEVAKTLHVSRAAERLGITQPALSHCLKRIEAETGESLFIRTKKGVTLTSAGQILLGQAQDLLSRWEQVLSAVKQDVKEVAGLIRLGCHSAVAQYTLPAILPDLLNDFPQLQLQLQHGLSRHMTERVVSNHLDIAFAINPSLHPDLIIKEVFRDQVTLWKSTQSKNEDVLLVEPSLLQSQSLMTLMDKKSLRFSRRIESSSLEVIAQLLVAGTGYALLPGRVVHATGSKKILAVKDAPVFEDRLCLVYKREFIKTRRGKVFVEQAFEKLTKAFHPPIK